MLAFELAHNTADLFVIVFIGFVLAKPGLVGHSVSKPLSNLRIYIIFPCAIIISFEVPFSTEVLTGLGITFAATAVVQLGQIALVKFVSKPLHLNARSFSIRAPSTS